MFFLYTGINKMFTAASEGLMRGCQARVPKEIKRKGESWNFPDKTVNCFFKKRKLLFIFFIASSNSEAIKTDNKWFFCSREQGVI